MGDKDNNREILSAALSAHVSELRLFWRETGLSCRWLVPDGEHCFVDEVMVKYIADFRDTSEMDIVNEQVRTQWHEASAPLLEQDEIGVMPFPLRTLTWILRVIESPHREDLTTDQWNLYLWSVRIHDLPSRVADKVLPRLGNVRIIDFDTLVTRFVEVIDETYPGNDDTADRQDRVTLIERFDRLRRFKNLIFYGVANIGKANISKDILRNWKSMTGREIGMHCVTVFHSNSCYEDMVERRVVGDDASVRPTIEHCAPRVIAHHITDARYFFEPFTNDNIQEGLFLSLCRAAAYNPDKDFVFMVDCIDKARIEDVFGEVSHMFDSFARVPWRNGANGGPGAWDLEASGARSIRLSQSGRIFFIPGNVYILGTATETGLFEMGVDEHLFQTFAVEYLPAKSADQLKAEMLAGCSRAEFARLEEYVGHTVRLWHEVNEILISVGGHKNLIGYGPLLSMCREILQSGDVLDANKIVLDTWRFRMMPPIRAKMEPMLYGDAPQRKALDDLINLLNHSWLRIHVAIEGMPGSEAIYMVFDPV